MKFFGLREQMNNILVKHTGQSLKKIEKDTDRDLFMTGKQAVEYGLVDEVIVSRAGQAEGVSGVSYGEARRRSQRQPGLLLLWEEPG